MVMAELTLAKLLTEELLDLFRSMTARVTDKEKL